MTAYSSEELVARDYLVYNRPQVVINIVDASNLERNLYLTCQLLELGVPLVVALNMMDVAKTRGIEINAAVLAKHLQVPVVPIIARSGLGKETLLSTALQVASTSQQWNPLDISYGDDLDASLTELIAIITAESLMTDTYHPRYTAI